MDWNNLARAADLAQGQHSTSRPLTMAEVRKRRDWCVIRGKVYDYSKYVPYHPGGSEELERGAGDDCTALFDEFHPWVNVDAMLRKCQVGVLVDPEFVWTRTEIVHREDLGGGHFYRLRLSIGHDSKLVRELKEAREKTVMYHVKVRTKMGNGKRFIERPYTPLLGSEFDQENDDGDSVISLLVKRSLRKNRVCLTHALCGTEAGPFEFEVQFKPCLLLKDDWYHKSSAIGMVCAGSGITPALQILSREAQASDSQRRLHLVWCNRDEKHVALLPEFRKLMVSMKGRFMMTHLFSRVKGESTSGDLNILEPYESIEVGRFDEEFLAKRPDALPAPSKSDNVFEASILICGPWDFEKSVRATMFMSGFSTDALIRIPG